MGKKEAFPNLSGPSREKRLVEVREKRKEIIAEGKRGQGLFTTWYSLPSDPDYSDEVPLTHLLFTASLSRKYDDIFYLYQLETYDGDAYMRAYKQAELEFADDEDVDIDRRTLELLKAGVEITPYFLLNYRPGGHSALIEVVGVVDVYCFDSDGIVRAINMFLDLGETDYEGEPLAHRASEGFLRILEEELGDGGGREVIATEETLEAVKRLKAGQGLKMSFAEFRHRLLEVFPEYRNHLLKTYEREKKDLAHLELPTDLYEKKSIILDRDFLLRLGSLQDLDFTFEELAAYLHCLSGLSLGGRLKKEEHDDHSVENQGTEDLKSFKSFCVRFALEPENRIICLYSVKNNIPHLANIGRHNFVYRLVESDGNHG